MKNFEIIFVAVIVLFCEAARAQEQVCNMTQAANCVKAMEKAIGQVMATASGVTRTETLQGLCLDVIKGNNLTQCYLQATGGCGGQGGGHTPSPTMQDWERIMQDLYTMCDGACPNFMEKTINITQCTSLIRFDDLFDNSYLTFCRSLNASLQCSREVSADCPLFSQLFFDLLPRGIDETADTICTSGCDNFEEALNHLESCKTHVTNLPSDLDAACSAYANFRTCLQATDVPMTCPIFGALMDVLYPQHIFGIYEEQCNTTDEEQETDQCGSRAVARIDHCLRILALAWPISLDSPAISRQQCTDFRSGLGCLDKAGMSECSSLQQYFNNQTADKHRHKAVLEKGCPVISHDVSTDSSSAVTVDVSTESSSAVSVCSLHIWTTQVSFIGSWFLLAFFMR